MERRRPACRSADGLVRTMEAVGGDGSLGVQPNQDAGLARLSTAVMEQTQAEFNFTSDGVNPVSANGQASELLEDGQVVFSPIASIAPASFTTW